MVRGLEKTGFSIHQVKRFIMYTQIWKKVVGKWEKGHERKRRRHWKPVSSYSNSPDAEKKRLNNAKTRKEICEKTQKTRNLRSLSLQLCFRHSLNGKTTPPPRLTPARRRRRGIRIRIHIHIPIHIPIPTRRRPTLPHHALQTPQTTPPASPTSAQISATPPRSQPPPLPLPRLVLLDNRARVGEVLPAPQGVGDDRAQPGAQRGC